MEEASVSSNAASEEELERINNQGAEDRNERNRAREVLVDLSGVFDDEPPPSPLDSDSDDFQDEDMEEVVGLAPSFQARVNGPRLYNTDEESEDEGEEDGSSMEGESYSESEVSDSSSDSDWQPVACAFPEP